jgi:hypothetical protein
MSYEGEKYIALKISAFVKATGLTNTILKPSEVQKHYPSFTDKTGH